MNRPEVTTVLICGAGQLGSRYLQGLATCRVPLRIHVQDVSEDSLRRAEQRWSEVSRPQGIHVVSFHESLDSIPPRIEVAVVATTADVRPRVVGHVADVSSVRYWVLEKVLAQSESGLDELIAHVTTSEGAWVNTPRRMMPWHDQIKSQLGLQGPLKMRCEGGGWGLACNSVHFLDLLAWWTGETLKEVTVDRLQPDWFESKRRGFWEVSGTLEAIFSGGSSAVLSAFNEGPSPAIDVTDGKLSWRIDESEGLARRSDGVELRGYIQYQSEITAGLVESLVEGTRCQLPTLGESAAIHRLFIRGLQEHWRRAGPQATSPLQIT